MNKNGRMKTKISVLLCYAWLFLMYNGPVHSATIATSSTPAPTTTIASTTSSVVTTTASPITTTAYIGSNLSCYDCTETFKQVWEPYTQCQYYPRSSPLRPCLQVDRYCKVERVTYKSVTVSITRSCTQQCWHGCYASGFGITKLRCTSCCLSPGCNVDNLASISLDNKALIYALCFLVLISS